MIEFLQHVLALIVSYLGFFAGRYLLFIAPEELEPGKKWLQLFSAFTGMLFVFLSLNHLLSQIIGAIAAFVAIIYIPHDISSNKKNKSKYIITISTISGALLILTNNFLLSSALGLIFFMPLSGFFLSFEDKDVVIKRGIVKRKLHYLLEILLPTLPYFIGIMGYFF